MIPTWFDTAERIAALRALALELEGTPFFANSEAPGRTGGMDCVRLLHYIDRTLGVLPTPVAIPFQVMDGGHHAEKSRLIEAFETWPALTERYRRLEVPASVDEWPARLLPGDKLCFRAGRVPHHGGVYLGAGEFFHTLRPVGAHRLRLHVALRGWRILGELAAAYRPLP